MTIGAGIFLSAVFLGCVLLYLKSENKTRWRKGILFCLLSLASLFSLTGLYIWWYEKTKDTSLDPKTKDHSIYQIRPGDKLSDIQFRNGKATREKGSIDGYQIYKLGENIQVWAKGDVADAVFYSCKTADFTTVANIGCGYTEQRIFENYKRKDVTILCLEDVETRIYEIEHERLMAVLTKNSVIWIGIFLDPKNRFRPSTAKLCN